MSERTFASPGLPEEGFNKAHIKHRPLFILFMVLSVVMLPNTDVWQCNFQLHTGQGVTESPSFHSVLAGGVRHHSNGFAAYYICSETQATQNEAVDGAFMPV